MDNMQNKVSRIWSKLSKLLKEKFMQLTFADLKLEISKKNDPLNIGEARLKRNRLAVVTIPNKNMNT